MKKRILIICRKNVCALIQKTAYLVDLALCLIEYKIISIDFLIGQIKSEFAHSILETSMSKHNVQSKTS